jgi:hypothetical protein
MRCSPSPRRAECRSSAACSMGLGRSARSLTRWGWSSRRSRISCGFYGLVDEDVITLLEAAVRHVAQRRRPKVRLPGSGRRTAKEA